MTFLVPLFGDEIETSEGGIYNVVSYNNFKSMGPAVYVDAGSQQSPLTIYFVDIVRINGVRVELDNKSKVFVSHGKIKRRQDLPQPGDTITIIKQDTNIDDPDDQVEVKSLKLHSQQDGIGKGLLIVGDDGKAYRLDDIIKLNRAIGSSNFDRKKFLKIYSEYKGYR